VRNSENGPLIREGENTRWIKLTGIKLGGVRADALTPLFIVGSRTLPIE
jgi:hypothetical protein